MFVCTPLSSPHARVWRTETLTRIAARDVEAKFNALPAAQKAAFEQKREKLAEKYDALIKMIREHNRLRSLVIARIRAGSL